MTKRDFARHVARAAAVAGFAVLGCGSDDAGNDAPGGDGAVQGKTGNAGGGGDSTGGRDSTGGNAGTGGRTATGGNAATGGGTTSGGAPNLDDLESRAFTACSNWQANGFVRGCTAVNTPDYVENCQAELATLAQACASEVVALLECATLLSALDFTCDANDDISFAAGVCEEQASALDRCAR